MDVHGACPFQMGRPAQALDDPVRYSSPGHLARSERPALTSGVRSTMRRTIIGAWVLGVATVVTFGCFRASHPSHKPDEQGNAAPLKEVAPLAHAREANQLEPYDGVDHLYKNAKSSLPTSV